jgi:hypothetical protein
MNMLKILTPFQGLLMLIDNNKLSNNKTEVYKKYSMLGFEQDLLVRKNIETILQEKFECSLTSEFKIILNDPIRNYFETHLAYFISKKILNDQSFRKKIKLFLTVFENQKNKMLSEYPDIISKKILKALNDKKEAKTKSIKFALENFKDDDEKTLILNLLDFVWFSIHYEATLDFQSRKILNIYGKDDFHESYKAKEAKLYRSHSNKAGIMRANDASPYYDEIATGYFDNPCNTFALRCPDMNFPLQEKNKFPDRIYKSDVNVFVNSLSGTTLAILRLYIAIFSKSDKILTIMGLIFSSNSSKRIEMKEEFTPEFKNQLFFSQFFKVITSLLLYLEGGHSMFEFSSVLSIPKIKELLSNFVPNIEEMNIEYLYHQSSKQEYEKAISMTISHFKIWQARKSMLTQIKTYSNVNQNSLISGYYFIQICIQSGVMNFSKVSIKLKNVQDLFFEYKRILETNLSSRKEILMTLKTLVYEILDYFVNLKNISNTNKRRYCNVFTVAQYSILGELEFISRNRSSVAKI